MGAGPVPIAHEVAVANGVVINHLGDTMDRVIERVKLMAGYCFQTTSKHIFGISGPATAAMEMGVTSVLGPGKKAHVLQRPGKLLGNFRALEGFMGLGIHHGPGRPSGPRPFRAFLGPEGPSRLHHSC